MTEKTSDSNEFESTVIDPSYLTMQQISRTAKSERDYVDGKIETLRQRLTDVDRATTLLNETVNRVPTDVQLRVGHLQELIDAQFQAVQMQFKERDTRSERESRDNKVAVDAAFAAQKEAAAKQDESNQKAIDKSEKSTTETIRTNANLFLTTNDNIKERLASVENALTALQSVKAGGRETFTSIYAFVGFILTVLLIGGILTAVIATKK